MEHLGRTGSRSGIADQGVRHGAHAGGAAEIMGGGIGRVADEADGADLPLCPRRADAGRIGHDLRHLGAGAVPGVHGEEGDLGQVRAHREGVVGRDAGRTQLHQEQRLQIDQMVERAGDIQDRLTGADPAAFPMDQVDLDLEPAFPGDALKPLHRQPGG